MNNFLDLLSQVITVFLGIFIEAVPFFYCWERWRPLREVFFNQEELARMMPRQPFFRGSRRQFIGIVHSGL